jgi:putative adhesin
MSITPPRGRSAAYRLPGVALLALLGGGGILTAHQAEREHHSTTVITPSPRPLLWLHTGGADVDVAPGPGRSIRIERHARWGGRDRPSHAAAGDSGGGIVLDDGCPSGFSVPAAVFTFHDACRISYRVMVPPGQAVRIDGGSGDISATGLRGRVILSSGSGDVRARDLASSEVRLATGSGDVSATFERRPRSLRATAGSGDVSLDVPAGRYRLDTSTGSGDRSIDSSVAADAAASAAIYARTGSGDLSVRSAGR